MKSTESRLGILLMSSFRKSPWKWSMGQNEIHRILGQQKGNLPESLLCRRAVGRNENEADEEKTRPCAGFSDLSNMNAYF